MAVTLNPQRREAFDDRYAARDKNNKQIEKTPEEMWSRVAKAIASDDGETQLFYDILRDFKFVPGGRIMAGAGNGTEQTFYNCYVIPVEPKPSTAAYAAKPVGRDSREAIFDTVATMVDIMSRGGGVGINWSTLRPSGSYLNRVSGTSSGPVGWMDVASKAVGEVEQGGSRRGAAMFMLDDWHPDILKFIEAKRDFTKITNANVSVAVSDEFMEAVEGGRDWTLRFPDTSDPAYNTDWDGDIAKWTAAGNRVNDYATLPAREVWAAIVESAHASGEPGVVFLGRYNALSTGRDIERIICVNPCGEQGLGAYSVCNLGSMNLVAYVHDGEFDWDSFEEDTKIAFRFLDNVIDKSYYWDERTREQQKKLRRVGLGIMGLADALILQRIRYGSEKAVKFTEMVFKTMKDVAILTSMGIAEEKGPAEAYNDYVWHRPYLAEFQERTELGNAPLRNLFFLTQAPTGTTSILAGVSSGIEPVFAWEFTRKDRTGTHQVTHPEYERLSGALPLPSFMVTANEVTVEEHIAMQAAAQKYIDSSVSKTINGPNSHTVEDVDKAYRLAYASGLKGLAYFRDGSGRDQVLTAKTEDVKVNTEELQARVAELEEQLIVGPMASNWRRPREMAGKTSRLNTSVGTAYLTVNRDIDTGRPMEIFVNVGKAGSDVMAMGEAVGRLISLGLQKDIPMKDIANQLVGVGGTSQINPGLVHAIGRALADESAQPQPEGYLADPLPVEEAPIPAISSGAALCPDCGEFSVAREEGCTKCYSCGWAAC